MFGLRRLGARVAVLGAFALGGCGATEGKAGDSNADASGPSSSTGESSSTTSASGTTRGGAAGAGGSGSGGNPATTNGAVTSATGGGSGGAEGGSSAGGSAAAGGESSQGSGGSGATRDCSHRAFFQPSSDASELSLGTFCDEILVCLPDAGTVQEALAAVPDLSCGEADNAFTNIPEANCASSASVCQMFMVHDVDESDLESLCDITSLTPETDSVLCRVFL